jgi:hypothetical protein
MKMDSFIKYEKIVEVKKELMESGMKLAQIKSILADKFYLSESMINDVLYSKRKKDEIEKFRKKLLKNNNEKLLSDLLIGDVK